MWCTNTFKSRWNWPHRIQVFPMWGPAGSSGLHDVTDAKAVLEDTALLAKLAPGDMIALEAKYHLKCLSTLYNRARATDSTSSDLDSNAHLYSIAFAELVAFMDHSSRVLSKMLYHSLCLLWWTWFSMAQTSSIKLSSLIQLLLFPYLSSWFSIASKMLEK